MAEMAVSPAGVPASTQHHRSRSHPQPHQIAVHALYSAARDKPYGIGASRSPPAPHRADALADAGVMQSSRVLLGATRRAASPLHVQVAARIPAPHQIPAPNGHKQSANGSRGPGASGNGSLAAAFPARTASQQPVRGGSSASGFTVGPAPEMRAAVAGREPSGRAPLVVAGAYGTPQSTAYPWPSAAGAGGTSKPGRSLRPGPLTRSHAPAHAGDAGRRAAAFTRARSRGSSIASRTSDDGAGYPTVVWSTRPVVQAGYDGAAAGGVSGPASRSRSRRVSLSEIAVDEHSPSSVRDVPPLPPPPPPQQQQQQPPAFLAAADDEPVVTFRVSPPSSRGGLRTASPAASSRLGLSAVRDAVEWAQSRL
jgi:hypothetical protein